MNRALALVGSAVVLGVFIGSSVGLWYLGGWPAVAAAWAGGLIGSVISCLGLWLLYRWLDE